MLPEQTQKTKVAKGAILYPKTLAKIGLIEHRILLSIMCHDKDSGALFRRLSKSGIHQKKLADLVMKRFSDGGVIQIRHHVTEEVYYATFGTRKGKPCLWLGRSTDKEPFLSGGALVGFIRAVLNLPRPLKSEAIQPAETTSLFPGENLTLPSDSGQREVITRGGKTHSVDTSRSRAAGGYGAD